MEIKVSKYISQFLVDHGITDCFMVTGGGAMHLDDAIGHQEGLRCTFNHHEQACAIAAEGYTRMTGRLAAVCVTSGPGGTNAITGVMGGWLDSIPMFVISGQVKRETTIWAVPDLNLRQLGDQEFNIIDSVRNMTKYAVMVTNPQEIAYHLEKAIFLSKNGRGGPFPGIGGRHSEAKHGGKGRRAIRGSPLRGKVMLRRRRSDVCAWRRK